MRTLQVGAPIFIEAAGSYAVRFLKKLTESAPVTGRIHSIYNKTINVSLQGQLLAIQSSGSPLSPLSLISSASEDELRYLGFSAGMMVLLLREQNSLYIRFPEAGQNFFLSDSCLVSDTRLNVHAAWTKETRLPGKKSLARLLRAILSDHTAKSLDLLFSDPEAADEILYVHAAGMRLQAAKEAYQKEHLQEAAKILCRLVGLGIGLTPSGDDFLCGLLAAIYFFGEEETDFARALLASLSDHLADTHDISRAFLSLAMEGEFSEAVCTLADTSFRHMTGYPFSDQNPEPVQDSLIAVLSDRFQKIGHSSGFDTLAGMLFYLTFFLEYRS